MFELRRECGKFYVEKARMTNEIVEVVLMF